MITITITLIITNNKILLEGQITISFRKGKRTRRDFIYKGPEARTNVENFFTLTDLE